VRINSRLSGTAGNLIYDAFVASLSQECRSKVHMFRQQTKKRSVLKNFQIDVRHDASYPHRLNFYTVPPRNEITLEEFELWAIDRLYGMLHLEIGFELTVIVLGEIESSLYRNKTQKDMEVTLKQLFEKFMPLNSNTAHAGRGVQLDEERRKDHYSHFILRLAFCRSYLPSDKTNLCSLLVRNYDVDSCGLKRCYSGTSRIIALSVVF